LKLGVHGLYGRVGERCIDKTQESQCNDRVGSTAAPIRICNLDPLLQRTGMDDGYAEACIAQMSFANIADQDQLVSRLAAFHDSFRAKAVRSQHPRLSTVMQMSIVDCCVMLPTPYSERRLLQGWDVCTGSEQAAVLATLVRLAQLESGRNALISARVLDMVVQWLEVTLAELNNVTADKQQNRAHMERKASSDQQPAAISAAQHSSVANGSTDHGIGLDDPSTADGAEAAMPDASLQLLRLIRNLCAAGSPVAMQLTASEVPATLAGIILQLDPNVAGECTPQPCSKGCD